MRKTDRAVIVAAVVYVLLSVAMLAAAVWLARSVTLFAGGIR